MSDHGTDGFEPAAAASPPAASHVGPSPAPGTGSPATRPRLGRVGIALMVVIGVLYFLGWIAWAIFGPSIEVEVRDHHNRPNHEQGEPRGPGRLTLTMPGGTAEPYGARARRSIL